MTMNVKIMCLRNVKHVEAVLYADIVRFVYRYSIFARWKETSFPNIHTKPQAYSQPKSTMRPAWSIEVLSTNVKVLFAQRCRTVVGMSVVKVSLLPLLGAILPAKFTPFTTVLDLRVAERRRHQRWRPSPHRICSPRRSSWTRINSPDTSIFSC